MGFDSRIVPTVEYQWSHREFVESVRPDVVMIDIVSARQVIKKGKEATDFFPSGCDVVTTSTVPDRQLDLISWEKEAEIVSDFSPEYHIPTDYSISEGDPRPDRLAAVRKMTKGTRWMDEQLTGVEVIPQVKGFSPAERQQCYTVCNDLSRIAAYYAVQYFGGQSGNQIDRLVNDLREIQSEWDGEIFIIGLLSPNYLERLPENVTVAAGQYQWRSKVRPRDNTAAEINQIYDTLREEVSTALTRG